MQITASAVSLNVEDVAASSAFFTGHLGFRQEMAAEGFASLTREDTGMNVVFLRRGLEMLPDDQRDNHATGLILAFAVEDLEGELARLRGEGVAITHHRRRPSPPAPAPPSALTAQAGTESPGSSCDRVAHLH